jgi:hypothetical protein
MKKWYMFVTDSDGYAREVKVDSRFLRKQKRQYEAMGYTVTILDEDERIKYGLLTQNLLKQHKR